MKVFFEIMLCMLATYGAYRTMQSVKAICSRRMQVVLALRADGESEQCLERRLGRVSSLAISMDNAESEPAVLCEDEGIARQLSERGYQVYVRIKK